MSNYEVYSRPRTVVKTFKPLASPSLNTKCKASWLCEECRKVITHVDQMKETIIHVFGDNTTRTLGTIFTWHTRKWPPRAIENHLWSGRGLLAKLQAQVYHLVTMIPSRLKHVGNCSCVAFIYLALISPWKSLQEPPLKIGTKTEWGRWKTSVLARTQNCSEWPPKGRDYLSFLKLEGNRALARH